MIIFGEVISAKALFKYSAGFRPGLRKTAAPRRRSLDGFRPGGAAVRKPEVETLGTQRFGLTHLAQADLCSSETDFGRLSY